MVALEGRPFVRKIAVIGFTHEPCESLTPSISMRYVVEGSKLPDTSMESYALVHRFRTAGVMVTFRLEMAVWSERSKSKWR